MSHCDVDYGDMSEDAERVEFSCFTTPVARKTHRCHECGLPIQVGEKHQHVAYSFDGRFYSERRCLSCVEAMAEFEYDVYGGGFWQQMEEAWDEGANVQGCIARLTTAEARRRMHNRWLRWKGLADHRNPAREDAQGGPSEG